MREASSRQEAVKVGLLLVSTDYIHHVVDEHHFEDGYLFFRFRQDGQLTNEATTYIIESKQFKSRNAGSPSVQLLAQRVFFC